jgi:ADP-heptose:LPS heptosyltransferase
VQGLPDQPYAVLFPGAQEAIRRWPTAKFAALGDYLADKYGLQIVIDGSANDSSLAQEIITKSTHQNFIDFTGQTALPQLARVLSSARLVISNDTSAAHIAFAVGTDVLVIAQFSYHYHRFIPYPAEISGRRMLCLWPAEYRNLNTTELRVRSGRWSVADTDLISVAEARLAADKLMS